MLLSNMLMICDRIIGYSTQSQLINQQFWTKLMKNNDPLSQIVKQQDSKKKLYSIQKEVATFKKELDCSEIPPSDNEATSIYARQVKQ